MLAKTSSDSKANRLRFTFLLLRESKVGLVDLKGVGIENICAGHLLPSDEQIIQQKEV
jgi:hypothetical protein